MSGDLQHIMPTSITKYPGHIWKSGQTYRACFTSMGKSERHTRRFDTYPEAFDYLCYLSEKEGNKRVKNMIYRHFEGHYSVMLSNGEYMQFDETYLDLVQSHVWFMSTKGYVQCNKSKELPSTLFHVCVMGKAPDGFETIHLNGKRNDNRIENMRFVKKTRFTKKKETM